jgi:hypothetical protein
MYLESKALAFDVFGVQSFSFRQGINAIKLSFLMYLESKALALGRAYCAGTGLQPVPERFRGAAVSIKHCGRGCKPRPAQFDVGYH